MTGSPSAFPVVSGQGGLPKVVLAAPNGARAEVYLHGAHVTSWVPPGGPEAGGEERLFLSRTSEFRPGVAIRGGVPVIFPQFANEGPLPSHGFARVTLWEFSGVEAGPAPNVTAKFQLRDSETTWHIWPHAFLAELDVTLGGPRLELVFRVANLGDAPFEFTCALHTYLRVADAHATVIEGLGGTRYRERQSRLEGVQSEPDLRLSGPVDRVYQSAPAQMVVCESARTTRILSSGFRDVVVWNPRAGRGATLADLELEGYRRMVCVEAAVIETPVWLDPAQSWEGTQTLVV